MIAKNKIILETGITISEGQSYETDENGFISMILLDENTLGYSFLFKANTWLYLHTNGNIKQGTLAETKSIDLRFGLFTFEADSTIAFHLSGEIASGFNIYEGGLPGIYNFIKIAKGMIYFYANGSIYSCIPSNSIRILAKFGGEFKTKPLESIEFYEVNQTSEPIQILGVIPISNATWYEELVLAKNKRAYFYNNKVLANLTVDSLKNFYSPNQLYYEGYLIEDDHSITLYDNTEKLHEFSIAEELEINNIILKPKTILRLRENGKIKSFFSDKDVIVEGNVISKNTNVYFDEDGNHTPSL